MSQDEPTDANYFCSICYIFHPVNKKIKNQKSILEIVLAERRALGRNEFVPVFGFIQIFIQI